MSPKTVEQSERNAVLFTWRARLVRAARFILKNPEETTHVHSFPLIDWVVKIGLPPDG